MNSIRLAGVLMISLLFGSLVLMTKVPFLYELIFSTDNTASCSVIHQHIWSQLGLQNTSPLLIGVFLGSTLSIAFYNALRFFYTRYYSNLFFALALSCLLLFLFILTHPLTEITIPFLNYNSHTLYSLVLLAVFLLHAACLHCIPKPLLLGTLPKQMVWHMALLALSLVAVFMLQTSAAQMLTYFLLISSVVLLSHYTWVIWRTHSVPTLTLCVGLCALLLPLIVVWPCLITGCFLSSQTEALLILLSLLVSATLITIGLSQIRSKQLEKNTEALRKHATEESERRARSDLLAKISHEIRTPLSGVLGMTTLLLDTPLSSKQRDYAHTIQGSGNELLSLINEILDIARLESNEVVLSQTPFNLAGLLQECSQAFSQRAQEQQVELTVFIQPQAPEIILGDPVRFRQVLLSILSNAFKRTQQGEVIVRVTVDQQDQQALLAFCVQDTGVPLTEHERHMLSTTQLNSKDLLSASFIGGNLGIIIARQLILLMGGSFKIKPTPQGTQCTFSMPLKAQANQVSQSKSDAILRQKNILIIDSNALSAKVLAQQCSEWGMLVSTRPSIAEAVALLRNRSMQGQSFSVIIISETMRKPAAITFAVRIKEDPILTTDSTLIMLTSSSQTDSLSARNAGISHVLMKPVSASTLKTTLIHAVQHSTAALNNTDKIAGKRILVAEDDPTSVKVIAGLLSKLGISIDVAENGKIALAMLQKNHYDLVLMDCEMPVMDGFSAAQQRRAYEASHGLIPVPIIALSAHVFEEHHRRAKESGMNGHLAKPIELAKLQAILSSN